MDEKLYSIGKTASLCNISIDQLRNYDKIGLLKPQVRGDNKYRYYTESQIEDILIIKELKRIGVPLKMIAAFLKNQELDSIRATLEENMLVKRNEIAEKQRQYNAMVDALLTIEKALADRTRSREIALKARSDGSLRTSFEESFAVVPIAERPIVSIRKKSKCYKTNHYLDRYIELQNLIEEYDLEAGRSWFIVYHDIYNCIFDWGEDAEGDMEFFANIKSGGALNEHCRIFGGFLAASATYVGAYDNDRHKQVYEELTEWAKKLGYTTTGISYQELVVGRSLTSNEEDFVTKIYLPLNVDRM